MTYIVERQSALGSTAAYTGPMRTIERAERERDAWHGCGYAARVLDYTPEVKARVARWTKGERWPYDPDATGRDRLEEAKAVALDFMDCDTEALAYIVHTIDGRYGSSTDAEKLDTIRDTCDENPDSAGIPEILAIVGERTEATS